MFQRPVSRAASRPSSPLPSIVRSPDGLTYLTPRGGVMDFEIERSSKSATRHRPFPEPRYENTPVIHDYLANFLTLRSSSFSVSGRIVLDTSQVILFFRTKSAITHSLDFPVDVEYNAPASLEVLIGTCRPHETADFVEYPYRQSLFYPTELPFNCTIDLADHPILDAVRNTLFPHLLSTHHLTIIKDKLELVDAGSELAPQPLTLKKDGRAATIIITLPSRFEGGNLVIRSPEGTAEKHPGRGSKTDEVEWTAFLSDCQYAIERVSQGCRMTISFAVFVDNLDPFGIVPLVRPSDDFLDGLAPLLNLSRGHKIAFYLEFDYPANPAEARADSVIPILKSGDLLLYHALKLYKLVPELHWAAGGYMWPSDATVDFSKEDVGGLSPSLKSSLPGRMPFGLLNGNRSPVPQIHSPFGSCPRIDIEHDFDGISSIVEYSGAISLADADVRVMADRNAPTPVAGKERVYFVSAGELAKLVVNILLVVYVP